MTPASELVRAIERESGRRVSEARSVSGGSINQAYRVVLEDGVEAFVKTRPDAPPGEYATEAAALRWLGEPGTLAVPQVIAVGDRPPDGAHARFLALAWIDAARLDGDGEEQLGRGLAGVHDAGADAFGAPPPGAPSRDRGEPAPLRLGTVELSNEPLGDWASFYVQRRLSPLVELARDRGSLSAAAAQAVERVCARMGELAGPREPPARLHGDLWSGNVLAGPDERPVVIDPAAYGGHREIDLAMLALFGAPSPRLLAAYQEVRPLADGHEQRVGLWQLFPLLVHAVLFGGHYGESVHSTARRYL